jgi:hypothetical protein
MSILSIYMVPDTLKDGYKFSASGTYYAPNIGTLSSVVQYFESLPSSDDPEVFGMHENANVTFNTSESLLLMSTILSLQPRSTGGGVGKSSDDMVLELAELFEQECPERLDEGRAGPTTFVIQSNGLLSSLAICLTQEMVKFNRYESSHSHSLSTSHSLCLSVSSQSDRSHEIVSQRHQESYPRVHCHVFGLGCNVHCLLEQPSAQYLGKSLVCFLEDPRLVGQGPRLPREVHGLMGSEWTACCLPLACLFLPSRVHDCLSPDFCERAYGGQCLTPSLPPSLPDCPHLSRPILSSSQAIDNLSFEFSVLSTPPTQLVEGPEDGATSLLLYRSSSSPASLPLLQVSISSVSISKELDGMLTPGSLLTLPLVGCMTSSQPFISSRLLVTSKPLAPMSAQSTRPP